MRALWLFAVLEGCGRADPGADAPEGSASAQPLAASAPADENFAANAPSEPARRPAPGLADQLRAQFLGGPLRPVPVSTGRYGTKVSFRQHRFLTMEITMRSSITGEAVLSLQRDGVAHACFLVQTHDGSSSGKYANRDRIARSRDTKGGRLVGGRGNWVEQDDHVHITFDRLAYDGCQVAPHATPTPEPPSLDCFGFAANDRIGAPWLACRLEDPRFVAAQLGLFVDDSVRAGAWEHRNDPSGRGEPLVIDASARPWLLLAKPALEIDVDDTDRQGEIEVEIEVSTRELDESRWTAPVYEHRETPEQSQPPPGLAPPGR